MALSSGCSSHPRPEALEKPGGQILHNLLQQVREGWKGAHPGLGVEYKDVGLDNTTPTRTCSWVRVPRRSNRSEPASSSYAAINADIFDTVQLNFREMSPERRHLAFLRLIALLFAEVSRAMMTGPRQDQ